MHTHTHTHLATGPGDRVLKTAHATAGATLAAWPIRGGGSAVPRNRRGGVLTGALGQTSLCSQCLRERPHPRARACACVCTGSCLGAAGQGHTSTGQRGSGEGSPGGRGRLLPVLLLQPSPGASGSPPLLQPAKGGQQCVAGEPAGGLAACLGARGQEGPVLTSRRCRPRGELLLSSESWVLLLLFIVAVVLIY